MHALMDNEHEKLTAIEDLREEVHTFICQFIHFAGNPSVNKHQIMKRKMVNDKRKSHKRKTIYQLHDLRIKYDNRT